VPSCYIDSGLAKATTHIYHIGVIRTNEQYLACGWIPGVRRVVEELHSQREPSSTLLGGYASQKAEQHQEDQVDHLSCQLPSSQEE
jgi:hypothetical protein